MNLRLAKQIIYGVMYLVLFAAIISGIYFLILKPAPTCFDGRQNQEETGVDCGGPCLSCELKLLKPLATSTIQIIATDKNQLTAIAEIKNQNLNYGADKFIYTLDFYDLNGENIFSLKRDSFIYPAQIKPIVEPAIEVDSLKVARAELKIENLSWKSLEEFSPPNIQIREVKTMMENDRFVITGVAVNNNLFKLPRLSVIAVLVNSIGVKIGASKTLLSDLAPSEERFFKIFIPAKEQLIPSVDKKSTKVFWEARR